MFPTRRKSSNPTKINNKKYNDYNKHTRDFLSLHYQYTTVTLHIQLQQSHRWLHYKYTTVTHHAQLQQTYKRLPVTVLSIYYSNTPHSATTNTQVTSHHSTDNTLLFYVITVNSPNDDRKTTEHVRNYQINNNISTD